MYTYTLALPECTQTHPRTPNVHKHTRAPRMYTNTPAHPECTQTHPRTPNVHKHVLRHSNLNDLIVLDPLMDGMTSRLKDSCVTVRMLAVRGLGNVACGSPEKVKKHGSQLLTSMINAMDDREDPEHIVTQEAMSSLSMLLPHVQDRDMRSLLIHTAIRIRPFFDHVSAGLLFGFRYVRGGLFHRSLAAASPLRLSLFFEQILNGLVTLLLHLQDPKPGVVKVCVPDTGRGDASTLRLRLSRPNKFPRYPNVLALSVSGGWIVTALRCLGSVAGIPRCPVSAHPGEHHLLQEHLAGHPSGSAHVHR
uniref:Maestro/Maestro-like HEAT-repeats domain-containing protein n=1 Tax=Leptobrachium leishanense TaxID=445787 RepID=A0A8C5QE79_9ANUR